MAKPIKRTEIMNFSIALCEQAEAEAELDGVDARIQVGDARVGNVHIADFGADGVLFAGEMQAERASAREVDARSVFRHLDVCKECAAADLEVRHNCFGFGESPLKCEGIDPPAVSSSGALCDGERRHDVE